MPARRALLSVSDKTGLVDFARGLDSLGFELLSTGGTYRTIREAGIPVVEVGEFTGFPEILDGRLKTLHPRVHGGILAIRDDETHRKEMETNGLVPIDLVAVNLYPFEATVAKPDVAFEEAIENIDIGGPTMLRAAAKNHAFVTVIVDPADYPKVLEELAGSGETSPAFRRECALKVFAHTARYDTLIADWFGTREREFPQQLGLSFRLRQELRYGENPHQKAVFYEDFREAPAATVANLEQLQGKELSYNNLLDLDAALELLREFAGQTFCSILKHTNPCGASLGLDADDAFRKAWETDPSSAFGGIIGFTVPVGRSVAEAITAHFSEIVVAPAFSDEALAVFASKKNLRLMRFSKPLVPWMPPPRLRRVSGGLLVQEDDTGCETAASFRTVSKAVPTAEDLAQLEFAWKLAKHVKSNAIVYTDAEGLLGVGAGQVSRVDAARFGAEKALRPLAGSYLASDAFFPFRDGIDAAAAHGVRAIVQPGGSVRDQEVIDAADEHGMIMVFTGTRHFRH